MVIIAKILPSSSYARIVVLPIIATIFFSCSCFVMSIDVFSPWPIFCQAAANTSYMFLRSHQWISMADWLFLGSWSICRSALSFFLIFLIRMRPIAPKGGLPAIPIGSLVNASISYITGTPKVIFLIFVDIGMTVFWLVRLCPAMKVFDIPVVVDAFHVTHHVHLAVPNANSEQPLAEKPNRNSLQWQDQPWLKHTNNWPNMARLIMKERWHLIRQSIHDHF